MVIKSEECLAAQKSVHIAICFSAIESLQVVLTETLKSKHKELTNSIRIYLRAAMANFLNCDPGSYPLAPSLPPHPIIPHLLAQVNKHSITSVQEIQAVSITATVPIESNTSIWASVARFFIEIQPCLIPQKIALLS